MKIFGKLFKKDETLTYLDAEFTRINETLKELVPGTDTYKAVSIELSENRRIRNEYVKACKVQKPTGDGVIKAGTTAVTAIVLASLEATGKVPLISKSWRFLK